VLSFGGPSFAVLGSVFVHEFGRRLNFVCFFLIPAHQIFFLNTRCCGVMPAFGSPDEQVDERLRERI
jgi:hypothetical protein